MAQLRIEDVAEVLTDVVSILDNDTRGCSDHRVILARLKIANCMLEFNDHQGENFQSVYNKKLSSKLQALKERAY